MKRLLSLALCLCMILGLCACGPAETPGTPAPAPTAAPTEAAVDKVPTAPAEAPTEEVPAHDALTGQVLAASDQCSFTVTGAEFNAHTGLEISVLCENFSDRPLMFSWSNVSVCGYMYDPFWAEEVAAGKKVNSIIAIDTYALEQMNVTSVDEISFTLTVRDSEEFMNEPVVRADMTVYPTGKNAETVKFPVYEPKETDTVIVDNDDITFIVMGVDDELADLYTLHCYIANKTGKNLMFSWENVSVNGFMVDPFWAMAVSAGKQAYTDVLFYRADLEEQDIEVVQNVEFNLLVSDSDDWEADYLLNEIYTFIPMQ